MILRPGALVRAAIAATLAPGVESAALGSITLAPHQLTAARAAAALMRLHGGALLADDVGFGKTYTALAVARGFRRPLVVAPAALRAMWTRAGLTAGLPIAITTYEALSRGSVAAPDDADVLVLDEAHHARTPGTARYGRLVALAARAPVLLLSATPIANRLDDLRALFALFLGTVADDAPLERLHALVIRRTVAATPLPMPGVLAAQWVEVADDGAVARAITALPPSLPASDGGRADALLAYALLRMWSSSRASLVGAIRRRLAAATGLRSSLDAGRHPTRNELSAWTPAHDAVQLALPALLAPANAPIVDDLRTLRETVEEHEAALRALLALTSSGADADEARVAALERIADGDPARRILAFTSFAATARMYWRALRHRAGDGVLTAHGGEIASGPLSRDALLDRFAPSGRGCAEPPLRERVQLLVATDLLSEGLDLRDAQVIVHLDLPWSPSRLTQRVGRARRLGAPPGDIRVLAFRPPAAADVLLGIERRLRAKHALAGSTVGVAGTILPPVFPSVDPPPVQPSPVERASRVVDTLLAWRDAAVCPGALERRAAPVVACVSASHAGWVALVRRGARLQVVGAGANGRIVDQLDALDPIIRAADAPDAAPARAIRDAAAVRAEVERWLAAQRGGNLGAVGHVDASPLRRRLARQVDDAFDRLAPHTRAGAGALAARARSVIDRRWPLATEQMLSSLLAEAPHGDAATMEWFERLDDAVPQVTDASEGEAVDAVLALVLLVRATPAAVEARAGDQPFAGSSPSASSASAAELMQ